MTLVKPAKIVYDTVIRATARKGAHHAYRFSFSPAAAAHGAAACPAGPRGSGRVLCFDSKVFSYKLVEWTGWTFLSG